MAMEIDPLLLFSTFLRGQEKYLFRQIAMSDPLLHRLFRKNRLKHVLRGKVEEREIICANNTRENLRLDYLIGRLESPVPTLEALRCCANSFDQFIPLASEALEATIAQISSVVRNALYSSGSDRSQAMGLGGLISKTPDRGVLCNLDRSKYIALRNRVGKVARRKNDYLSSEKYTPLPGLGSNFVVVDHARMVRLRELILASNPFRHCVDAELWSSGVDHFIWQGAAVVCPEPDISFPEMHSFHLNLDSIEVGCDFRSLGSIISAPSSSLELGFQVMLSQFDNQGMTFGACPFA